MPGNGAIFKETMSKTFFGGMSDRWNLRQSDMICVCPILGEKTDYWNGLKKIKYLDQWTDHLWDADLGTMTIYSLTRKRPVSASKFLDDSHDLSHSL